MHVWELQALLIEALPQWIRWKSNGGWLPESILMHTSTSHNTDWKMWSTTRSSFSPSSTSLYPVSSDLFSCVPLGPQGPLQPREQRTFLESSIPKHNVTLTGSQFTSYRPSPSMGLHFYLQQQAHGVSVVSNVTRRCSETPRHLHPCSQRPSGTGEPRASLK